MAAGELLASQEQDLLLRCLALAWCLDDPESPYERERYDAFCAKDAQALLGSLLRTGYDIPEVDSLLDVGKPTVLRSAPKGPFDQIVLKGWTKSQTRTLGVLLMSAMKDKQQRRARHLLCPLVERHPENVAQILMALGVAESLATLVKTTTYLPMAHRIVRHALSSVVSTSTTRPLNITITPVVGRTLTIQSEALGLWHCDRRPFSDLQGAPVLVADPQATQYWVSLFQTHKGSLKGEDLHFQSQEDEESFYTQGFPHDIPDEWSDEERQKSHGIEVSNVPNPWVSAFGTCV